jgi:MFS family permease
VVGVALSIFSIILKQNSVNDFLIGFSDSFRRFCGLIFMCFVPFLTNKFGLKKIAITSILSYTMILLLSQNFINYGVWLLYMAIFGTGMMSFMTFIDATLNIVADEDKGFKNGLLNVVVLLGISIASAFLSFGEKNILYVCAILQILNVIYFIRIKEYKQIVFVKKLNLFSFLRENKGLFLSKIILEFTSNSLFLFTVIYFNKMGWEYKNGGLLLSIYCWSGLLTSILVGYLFDKKNKNTLLAFGTILTILLLCLIPFFTKSYLLSFLLYFGLGTSTNFIHIGCISILNSKYKKEELVSANSALTIIGSISIMISGLITGYSMKEYNSMVIPVIALGTIYLLHLICKKK